MHDSSKRFSGYWERYLGFITAKPVDFLCLILFGLGTLLYIIRAGLGNLGLFTLADIACRVGVMVAIYGLVNRKEFLTRGFWKGFVPFSILWFLLLGQGKAIFIQSALGIMGLLSFLFLVAYYTVSFSLVYAYAYREFGIWKNQGGINKPRAEHGVPMPTMDDMPTMDEKRNLDQGPEAL